MPSKWLHLVASGEWRCSASARHADSYSEMALYTEGLAEDIQELIVGDFLDGEPLCYQGRVCTTVSPTFV